MLHAGLDLSRHRVDVHVLDEAGATLVADAWAPDGDGLRRLAEELKRFEQPVRAAIESMNGARFVHDSLELAGWEVTIVGAVNEVDWNGAPRSSQPATWGMGATVSATSSWSHWHRDRPQWRGGVGCRTVLRFERDLVGALMTTPRQPVRSSVEAFVDGTLRDMAEWMRAGIAAESLLLGTYVALLRTFRPLDQNGLRQLLARWETSRIGPLAQYVRAMRSLVLFAENELAGADSENELAAALTARTRPTPSADQQAATPSQGPE
jgi:hypothetical protein